MMTNSEENSSNKPYWEREGSIQCSQCMNWYLDQKDYDSHKSMCDFLVGGKSDGKQWKRKRKNRRMG